MLENNGTTPESTQASTIPATLEEALIRGSELQLEILELKANLALVTETADTWRQNYYDSQDVILKARKYIEDTLAGDINAQQTHEDFRVPFELLGVEATREVQVTVTASWSGTVQLPYGDDLNDVSMSFSAEFDDLIGDLGWHVDDYSIEED